MGAPRVDLLVYIPPQKIPGLKVINKAFIYAVLSCLKTLLFKTLE